MISKSAVVTKFLKQKEESKSKVFRANSWLTLVMLIKTLRQTSKKKNRQHEYFLRTSVQIRKYDAFLW